MGKKVSLDPYAEHKAWCDAAEQTLYLVNMADPVVRELVREKGICEEVIAAVPGGIKIFDPTKDCGGDPAN